jgi:hypothetical protein
MCCWIFHLQTKCIPIRGKLGSKKLVQIVITNSRGPSKYVRFTMKRYNREAKIQQISKF